MADAGVEREGYGEDRGVAGGLRVGVVLLRGWVELGWVVEYVVVVCWDFL